MKLPAIKLPFSPKTLNIIVLILGVLILAALMYYSCANREGFDGSVPTAAQTSAIPSDTPGAVTANPTVAKPQTKDIQATLDELGAFFALASSFDYKQSTLPITTKDEIAMYRQKMTTLQKDMNDALASPETSKITLKDVTELRAKLAELSQTIHSYVPNVQVGSEDQAAKRPSYESTVVAGVPGVITLKELHNLVARIDEEHLRIANLRSTSATLLARQTQLEKLAADIRELIGAVERKEMKLEDVPISPATAEAFLKQMKGDTSLPPLIEPRAKIADGLQAHVTPTPAPGMDVKALYGLLDSAKYLKWNLEVKLEYDPKVAMRANLVERLEAVERRLSALAVSETPISKEMYEVFMKELQTIHAAIAPEGRESKRKSAQVYDRPATDYTRAPTAAEYPSADQMAFATSVRDPASGNAILNPSSKEVSPDVFVRPGFVMNDDTIKRRGSASAFDDSLVGGADYKKRSQELCRQVRGANLGDPAQFGCISNPDAVGSDYSWKGNFTMVCNRLGDTWGGWYPEMFGCPKYDPTQKFKATMM